MSIGLVAPGGPPRTPAWKADASAAGAAGAAEEESAASRTAPRPTALQAMLDPDPRDLDNDGADDATGVPIVRSSTVDLLDELAATRSTPSTPESTTTPVSGPAAEGAATPILPTDADLSIDERRMLQELRMRDIEVRTHEKAHQAAAGGLAGAARLSYQEGPDGRRYAVGGEVSIRHGGGATPDERIERARRVQAAATAPGAPSGADLAVASAAVREESHARTQMSRDRYQAADSLRDGYATGQSFLA